MDTYSQTRINGNVMPFIMGCTKPSSIETRDDFEKVVYDPMTQSTVVDMRIIGTRSLKTTLPKNKPTIDKKNEIDDSKYVK